MEFEIFEEKYDPIYNPRQQDTYLLDNWEDQGEWEYIKLLAKNNQIWTVIDGEGQNLYVIPGLHYVNRIGYIICYKPYEETCSEEYEY